MCLSTYIVCVDLRCILCFFVSLSARISLPVALPGACDGSVQSDTSSSPSEQSHLGHSHPAFSMGQQVSEGQTQHHTFSKAKSPLITQVYMSCVTSTINVKVCLLLFISLQRSGDIPFPNNPDIIRCRTNKSKKTETRIFK